MIAKLSLSRQNQAIIELTFAGALWGFGFVAATWSLSVAGPFTITGWRFVIAGLLGAITWRWLQASRSPETHPMAFKMYITSAIWPGIFIATLLVLQTWGLQYTTATKSGFITCLYVLIVPLIQPFLGGPRPSKSVILCAFGSVVGVALMCGLFNSYFTREVLDAKSRLNWGDFLTLLAAVAASFHILAIDRIGQQLGANFDSYKFNTAQSFMAGIPTLLIALAIEPKAYAFPFQLVDSQPTAIIGFTSLAIGSTLIAFALQVRAQKHIPPATASLLFLLESPFAAIFAALLLGEVTSPIQLLGGSIILASVIASVFALSSSTSWQTDNRIDP
jgi:drug/metabolite transporter (DMT)-like permease